MIASATGETKNVGVSGRVDAAVDDDRERDLLRFLRVVVGLALKNLWQRVRRKRHVADRKSVSEFFHGMNALLARRRNAVMCPA